MKLTVQDCQNPRWADLAHTSVICAVQFQEHGTPLEFIAIATDPEPHGRVLLELIVAGVYGPIGGHVEPSPSDARKTSSPSLGTNKV